MSAFHGRIIKGKNGIDISSTFFKEQRIVIQEVDINTRTRLQKIDLSNKHGTCLTPTLYGDTEFVFKGKIATPGERDRLAIGWDLLTQHLSLPSNPGCEEYFDLEFLDELDRNFWTEVKVKNPPRVTFKDVENCMLDFEFTLIKGTPDYYGECYERKATTNYFCGNTMVDEDGNCKTMIKEVYERNFKRKFRPTYKCKTLLEETDYQHKFVIHNPGPNTVVPRITTNGVINGLFLKNITNQSLVKLDGETNNLKISAEEGNLFVLNNGTSAFSKIKVGSTISLDSGKNELIITADSDNTTEICIEFFATYKF